MMKIVVFLCVVASALAQFYPYPIAYQAQPHQPQPVAPVQPAVQPPRVFVPSAQFHSQNVLGGYNYGYQSGDGQVKQETRGADGTVMGTYSYLDDTGKPVQVSYSAGPSGFQASGLHLPQAPTLPEANLRAINEHNAAVAQARALAAVNPQPAPHRHF